MSKAPAPPVDVDSTFLAECFDCSTRHIELMAKDGVAVKIRHGRYDLKATCRNYVVHLREQAALRQGKNPDGPDPVEENALFKRLQRQMAEARFKQQMGELASRDDVIAAWSKVLTSIRSMVLAIPNRIAFELPSLTKHERKKIQEIAKEILEEVADGKVPEMKKIMEPKE